MPFKPGREFVQPDFKRLNSTLNTSPIKTKDSPLWQVINTILEFSDQAGKFVDAQITKIFGDIESINNSVATVSNVFKEASFLTVDDETLNLPNSSQLVAGTGITFDTTTPHQLILNSSGAGGGVQWSVLTDGDLIEPELVFAGGDVIMLHIP